MQATRRAATIDLRSAASVIGPTSPVALLACGPAARVEPGTTVAAAAEAMRRHGVSALLLGDAAGIVTERDIARVVAAGWDLLAPVEAVCSTDLLVIDGSVAVVDAAALMLNEHARHLVVRRADGGHAVLSIREVMAVLLGMAHPDLWLQPLRATLERPVWLAGGPGAGGTA